MASAVDEVAAPPRKLLIDRLREAAEAPPEYSEPPPELVQWSTTTFYSGYETRRVTTHGPWSNQSDHLFFRCGQRRGFFPWWLCWCAQGGGEAYRRQQGDSIPVQDVSAEGCELCSSSWVCSSGKQVVCNSACLERVPMSCYFYPLYCEPKTRSSLRLPYVRCAAQDGFIEFGLHSLLTFRGLQMMGFTALFTGVYLYLQDYRDKRDILNMSVGGSATGV